MSSSTSVSERTVKRFTEGDIQHLPKRRAVLHLFDGDETQEAKAFEVTPYYRLAYHLLSPLEHASVACPRLPRRGRHAFAPFTAPALGSKAAQAGLRCEACGFELAGEALDDRRAYAAAFPQLLEPL